MHQQVSFPSAIPHATGPPHWGHKEGAFFFFSPIRGTAMPVGLALVGVAQLQERRFVEGLAD